MLDRVAARVTGLKSLLRHIYTVCPRSEARQHRHPATRGLNTSPITSAPPYLGLRPRPRVRTRSITQGSFVSEHVDNSEDRLEPPRLSARSAWSVASRETGWPEPADLNPTNVIWRAGSESDRCPRRRGSAGSTMVAVSYGPRLPYCGRESSPWCRTRRFEDGRRGPCRDASAVMPQVGRRTYSNTTHTVFTRGRATRRGGRVGVVGAGRRTLVARERATLRYGLQDHSGQRAYAW